MRSLRTLLLQYLAYKIATLTIFIINTQCPILRFDIFIRCVYRCQTLFLILYYFYLFFLLYYKLCSNPRICYQVYAKSNSYNSCCCCCCICNIFINLHLHCCFLTNQEQLQQLRDMGITDEALARRALQASGGDIQAALEFIFGDDMQ